MVPIRLRSAARSLSISCRGSRPRTSTAPILSEIRALTAGTACPIGNFDITTAAPFAAGSTSRLQPGLSARDTQIGLYVSDEWKPDDHWTVNAGLRWDFESNPNNKDYVTPPAIADALRAYPGWAARGIDPEDYISNGHNRKPFYGEFQPRLGVSYDVHGDRDMVFFGGAGRYYDRTCSSRA